MSISQILQQATIWFGWLGLALIISTIIFFIFNFGGKFRLVGASIFTLLLSASCWAFEQSYTPPLNVDGYKYAPIVYDNGFDLVVAQAPNDFPKEAIKPTLLQIAGNLKGGGRNGARVKVRLRKVESAGDGISKPIILGEIINDLKESKIIELPERIYAPNDDSSKEVDFEAKTSLEKYEE